MIPICQVMTRGGQELLVTQTVSEANGIFQASGLTSLPVVDRNRKLVGILFKDCLEAPPQTSLGKLVSRLVPAVNKNFPADKALELDFQILPVVNSKKQLVGIVERQKLEELFHNCKQVKTNFSTGSKKNVQSGQNLATAPTNPEEEDLPNKTLLQKVGSQDYPSQGDEYARTRTMLLHKAGIIAYSPKMMELIDLSLRAAQVDSTVSISGESGVGKDLLANLIHDQSSRSLGPFVEINCGAIPVNLLESELFGYESGAFTGASRQGKLGMFELANGGTLFLDEIGELPLSLQVKLLRALQEQEFVRVGGVKVRKVDVRFITATNRNLEKMVEEGRFREDLYFRLNVVPLRIPPLRERKEDILPLVHHFQVRITQKFKVEKNFAPEVMRAFIEYQWPGNVRELENIVERLFVITPGQDIRGSDLPEKFLRVAPKNCIRVTGLMPLREAVDEVQRLLIEEALTTFGGNTYQAAQALQVDPSTIVRKLAKLRERKK